jgi:D-glycero-alpha-D-manno-heptose-7-phosphate kinase
VQVHSSAPTRIDLAGGTLDIWPLYLFHEQAQTLNAAISLRAHCTLSPSLDGAIHVISKDSGTTVRVRNLTELDEFPEHRLVARLLRFFRTGPLTIKTWSAAPVGAGLAGSSALNIAVCGALAKWHDRSFTSEDLMQLAQNLEAQIIGVPTGVQDFPPAMYGGLSAIEMGPTGIKRLPLSVDLKDLERRLLLAYTGESRDSGINNWVITKRHIDGDQSVFELFESIRDIAKSMRQALEAEEWPEVGRQFAKEWDLRTTLTPAISTPTIDKLVGSGLSAGASAAKICGAGGGGCLMFFADPSNIASVREAVEASGAQILDFLIDRNGLCVDTE